MFDVIVLYAALIDPRWEVREEAERSLVRLIDRHPRTFGPRLEELASKSTEPEIRARCRAPIAVYYRWRVNSFVPAGVPCYPCCDMMPVANPLVPFGLAPDVRDRGAGSAWYCLDGPCVPGAESAPYWSRYRMGTARMVRSMLMDGVPEDDVSRLLVRMWAVECAAKGDCAAAWPEAQAWTRWQGGFPRPRSEP